MTSEARENLLKKKEDILENIQIFTERIQKQEETLVLYENEVVKKEKSVALANANLNEAVRLRDQQKEILVETRQILRAWSSALTFIEERIDEITSPNV